MQPGRPPAVSVDDAIARLRSGPEGADPAAEAVLVRAKTLGIDTLELPGRGAGAASRADLVDAARSAISSRRTEPLGEDARMRHIRIDELHDALARERGADLGTTLDFAAMLAHVRGHDPRLADDIFWDGAKGAWDPYQPIAAFERKLADVAAHRAVHRDEPVPTPGIDYARIRTEAISLARDRERSRSGRSREARELQARDL